ncbi:hypothetical protein SFR_3986 [Streptomyces sp. FR-008]|nr:hypothetical protein SFR_3986 [Streptomyces sp. FR-008]
MGRRRHDPVAGGTRRPRPRLGMGQRSKASQARESKGSNMRNKGWKIVLYVVVIALGCWYGYVTVD